MASHRIGSYMHAENFPAEPADLRLVRESIADPDIHPITPSTGALLTALAASTGSRHVLETGPGGGLAGLWLLRGMPADGILTSIDDHHGSQVHATAAFRFAGIPPARRRVITAETRQILPRLATEGYDLIFLDGPIPEIRENTPFAIKLLRPHGLLILNHMLLSDQVADPANRNQDTQTARQIAQEIQADSRLHTTMLGTGDGLLIAVRKAA